MQNIQQKPFSCLNYKEELPFLIPRKEINNYFGGLFTSGYMAYLDNRGLGPHGSYIQGKNVVYSRDDFLIWLDSRLIPR